jgi:hypothetical protein
VRRVASKALVTVVFSSPRLRHQYRTDGLLELAQVDRHHPLRMALDRLVEHPRVAGCFDGQFIFLPQLPSKKPQLPHPSLPQIRPAIFQLRAYDELRPMQVTPR